MSSFITSPCGGTLHPSPTAVCVRLLVPVCVCPECCQRSGRCRGILESARTPARWPLCAARDGARGPGNSKITSGQLKLKLSTLRALKVDHFKCILQLWIYHKRQVFQFHPPVCPWARGWSPWCWRSRPTPAGRRARPSGCGGCRCGAGTRGSGCWTAGRPGHTPCLYTHTRAHTPMRTSTITGMRCSHHQGHNH